MIKRAVCSAVLSTLFASTVLAQARQTDREFDGLKGKVKTVTVEEARLDEVGGASVEGKRVPSRSVAYDADGNWTQWKDYDDKGRLMRSLVFSFIGGDRVALSEDVELPPDALVMVKPVPRGRRRPDSRYHYKFKYVYAPDGRRTGESWFFNDGRLYLRQVYTFKGGRKVRTMYDERGRLNDRQESVLDERGNEVEALLHDTFADKLGYKYVEFDSQGNWTKRILTRGFKDVPGIDFAKIKPWSVEYRTITYH